MGAKYQRWTDEERARAAKVVREQKLPREVYGDFPGRSPQDVRNMIKLARYRLDGRCGCGRPMPEDPGYALMTCPRCVEKKKLDLVESRKNGGCFRCGRPADATLSSCRACFEKRRTPIHVSSTAQKPDRTWTGVLRWLASGRMSTHISAFPPGPWKVVDLFGGSASLSIEAVRAGHPEVVYNDAHPILCDLVRAVRDGYAPEVMTYARDVASMTPEGLLDAYRHRDAYPPLHRAAILLVLAQSIEQRDMGRPRVAVVHGVAEGYLRRMRQLRPILARIDVRNQDFAEIIREHDGPRTFFFADPPYPLSTRYEHNLTPVRFIELVEALRKVQGHYMLLTSTTRFAASCLRDLPYTWWQFIRYRNIQIRMLVATNYLTSLDPANLSMFALRNPADEADRGLA